MQSNVPPLPISCLSNSARLHRNNNLKSSIKAQESTNISIPQTNRKPLSLFSNKKKLCPLIARDNPYKNSKRNNPPETAKSKSESVIRQRVLSAKMLRIKQLQNQLVDAHYHLNELSNENKLLKTIQKRQDAALKRYEGTNAELPRIINSHHEDIRVLQTKFKKLKFQYKNTSDTLKEKENELHSLQVQNKKLLQLSKDRQLGEREKLQIEVSDLNHRIHQQDEVIQTLRRKLTLESKYLKHQLHTEMAKHKETQKQLQETTFKLKSLEELTEQKAKNRITFFNKDRATITSQSLTNLSERRSEILIKAQTFRKHVSERATGQSLPALHGFSVSSRSRSQENKRLTEEPSLPLTETRANFEQIRHFRLDKSPNKSTSFSTSKSSVRDSPIKESRLEKIELRDCRDKSDVNSGNVKVETLELPKNVKEGFSIPSHDERNVDEASESLNYIGASRSLHARLINSAGDGMPTNKAPITSRSMSIAKENISDKESNYDPVSAVTIMSKDTIKKDTDAAAMYSDDDFESEIDIPIEFGNDEDKNVIPKSDIASIDLEAEKQTVKSPHLSSKLFRRFSQVSSRSFDFNNTNNEIKLNLSTNIDKVRKKSMDDSLLHSNHCINDDNNLIHNSLAQEEFIPAQPSSDNNTFRNYSKTNGRNSFLDQTSNDVKSSTTSKDKKVLDFNEENLKEIERNARNTRSSEKTSYGNLKESDLKRNEEQKTVENSRAFDKAKLLAAMKAIDDNENIEFIDKKIQNNSVVNSIQMRENLYKGMTKHSRNKSDIIKELFTE